MQNTSDTQGHNLTRDDQSKGGQHSNQGSNDAAKSSHVNENDQRNQGRTGQETPEKGGQPTRSGNK